MKLTHQHNHGAVGVGRDHRKRLLITLLLTSSIFIVEIIGSAITGSLALLVDAGHMFTDISVLAASTLTAFLLCKKPDKVRTWGWARLEVITAAAGGVLLLFVGIYAIVEACIRLFGGASEHINDIWLLLCFGILGLLANLGSIIVLRAQSQDNMNMRAAFLEVINDALGSVAVIISAIVMETTGWDGFDAFAGGLIAIMMIPRAYLLIRDAVRVLLEEVPEGLDLDAVRKHLEQVPHVLAVHDLHASTIGSGMPILTAHIVVESDMCMEQAGEVLEQLQTCLREHFPVSVPHTTFQLEPVGYTSPSASQIHA